MKKTGYILAQLIFLASCVQPSAKKDGDTVVKGSQSVTISTDTAKLASLINIAIFKPANVKFKYLFFDNSGQNQRISVPGPSDSYLEAILYFDSATFTQLKGRYFMADYPLQQSGRQDFNFEWLDNDVKNELLNCDTNYHGHPDLFFGGSNKLWLLNNKLLLRRSTN
jgi:hypothetical protein